MPPLETRTDSLGRLQKYPKIHVSTGEDSSGSGTDFQKYATPNKVKFIMLGIQVKINRHAHKWENMNHN